MIKRVTRETIARMANVSLATVTYALSGENKIRISNATREKIQRIAEEMGYRPDFVRRAISAGKTFTVGFVVPEERSLLFPLYELIIDGCVSAMNKDNYDPLLLFRSRPERLERVVRDGRVDGLFILQSDKNDNIISQTVALGLPIVVLNRNLPQGFENENAVCVVSDHRRMMSEVIDELVELGCKHIINFCASGGIYALEEIYAGFNAAVAKYANRGVIGSTIEPVWEHSELQMKALFDNGINWDGIFINGSPAVGHVIKAAEARGLKVGHDFQLITADAFPEVVAYEKKEPHKRRERCVYWQQPQLIGSEGWRVMSLLLSGKECPREIKIPYKKEVLQTN